MKTRGLIPVISLAVTVLVSCGEDSSDQPRPSPVVTANASPVAKIDGVLTAEERTQITLNASQSSDSDGQITRYAWSIVNTANSDIQLEGSNSATLTVRIGELADDVSPEIRLMVTDDDGATNQVSVTTQFAEVDRDRLPPDPGDAGQQSVAGIDSDNDGIRDDVERSLLELLPLETERRQLLMRGGQAFQDAIVSGAGGIDTQEDRAYEDLAKFSKCLVMISPETIPQELAVLRTLLINTPERQAAYRAFNASRAGTIQRTIDDDFAVSTRDRGRRRYSGNANLGR